MDKKSNEPNSTQDAPSKPSPISEVAINEPFKFGGDGNTDMNKLFEQYKNKPSVLQPKIDTETQESVFLKKQSTEEKPVTETIQQPQVNSLFEAKGNLYKFFTTWENLGEGTIYVIDEKFKRLVFVRAGISIPAFNFYVNFDLKPNQTGKSVKFVGPDMSEKPSFSAHAIKFADEAVAKEFLDLISQTK